MVAVNPSAIAPEPQEDAQNDEGAIEIPESGLTGLVDASTGENDASTTEPEKLQEEDNGLDLGGWRYLSCGRKNGQARFRLALGSGRTRQWMGPILTISESSSIAERNKHESTKQNKQRAAVNQARNAE